MKTSTIALLLCFCLTLGLLSGCGQAVESEASVTDVAETVVPSADTSIVFSALGVDITGAGASLADDGDVKISVGGVYAISGVSDNARVVVDASEADDVTLILAGCDLACPDDEVIYGKIARSVTVVLTDGTENTLTSGEAAQETETDAAEAAAEEDASGAALRAKCAMTITGGGRLAVYGYVNNGIAANGDLRIESGVLTVTAVNDAIKSRSDLLVSGGAITVLADQDGLQADGTLTITGGELGVCTGSGAEGASMKVSDSSMMGNIGGGRGRNPSDEASGETEDAESAEAGNEQPEDADTSAADDENAAETPSREMRMPWDADDASDGSHKGLKAEGDIVLSGGAVTLDTEDDAIHAGGDVWITGGTIAVESGDDGIHADGELTITGGTLTVAGSYEGLEATAITITDGVIDVIAADDGMNVNGGDFGPMFGRPSGEASAEAEDDETDDAADDITPTLRITGGTVLVDSGGDGLDSNGDIFLEGGMIYVSGPSSDWDAAIDYGDGGYDFIITGGIVMAGGYSGMAETPDLAENAQPSIWYRFDETLADGETVTLTDAEGTLLLQYSFVHGYNCVVLSSPELTVGETYTLSAGDQTVTIELTDTNFSNRASRGGFGGGSREMSAIEEADG